MYLPVAVAKVKSPETNPTMLPLTVILPLTPVKEWTAMSIGLAYAVLNGIGSATEGDDGQTTDSCFVVLPLNSPLNRLLNADDGAAVGATACFLGEEIDTEVPVGSLLDFDAVDGSAHGLP